MLGSEIQNDEPHNQAAQKLFACANSKLCLEALGINSRASKRLASTDWQWRI